MRWLSEDVCMKRWCLFVGMAFTSAFSTVMARWWVGI